MKQLSAILRCVSNERKPKPLERYREFVEALQMWATSLPDHLQFGTFPPEPQALTLAHLSALTESEKAALVSCGPCCTTGYIADLVKLNLQTMRLGIIVVLTWPSLHDVMENPSKRDAKDDVDHEAAHTW